MTDPKRRKLSKCIMSETRNVGECSYPSKNVIHEQATCKFDSLCHITDLPSEVIISIYNYLTPADLVTMTKVGNHRLKDLTFYIENANFSSSVQGGTTGYLSEFFSRVRVKSIKKINFNYVAFIKPRIITHFICRCKNLTVLSIIECGINYQNLIKILNNCTLLEKLFWNLDENSGKFDKEKIVHSNVKFASLFCHKSYARILSINFLYYCLPNAKNVWIHCCADAVSKLPFLGVWLKASSLVSPTCSRRITIVSNSFQTSIQDKLQQKLHIFFELTKEFPFDKDSCNTLVGVFDNRTFAFDSCVQIKSNIEDILSLSTKQQNLFSTMSIILTPEILDVSENISKCVAEVSGDKLRQLSLQSEAYHFTDLKTAPMPISSEESLAICDVLDKFANSCKYITDLNLITVHFTIGSPFKAISKLRFLKTLHLPSCAFFKSYNKVLEKRLLDSEPMRFEDVVANCVLVDTFALFCCCDDYGQLTDNDLYAMKNWQDLKCLTIYSIVVRTCYFLREVTNSCKKLQSLSLIAVSPRNMCIYTPDIIHVLKNAKNLSFIRINEENFNPMYERFWDAIAEASNLQGICISTRSRTYIDKSKVVASVKKLKYLKLFHFFSNQTTDRLFFEVRKIMQKNGICYTNIEANCFNNPIDNIAKLEYYHSEPQFCCQHIHFRDFITFC